MNKEKKYIKEYINKHPNPLNAEWFNKTFEVGAEPIKTHLKRNIFATSIVAACTAVAIIPLIIYVTSPRVFSIDNALMEVGFKQENINNIFKKEFKIDSNNIDLQLSFAKKDNAIYLAVSSTSGEEEIKGFYLEIHSKTSLYYLKTTKFAYSYAPLITDQISFELYSNQEMLVGYYQYNFDYDLINKSLK